MTNMTKQDEDKFYKAMLARDYRFDGKFFIGVKTTGIYCRPICPARPKRENVEFFYKQEFAEKKGYRPCLRCHPESAPTSIYGLGFSDLSKRVIKYVNLEHFYELNDFDFNEEKLSKKFGVSSRHLRRLLVSEIGKTPLQLYKENRLNMAMKLLVETSVKIVDIAYASGFKSLRRFNEAFKEKFTKTPSAIRRSKALANSKIKIFLSYRPPYDFQGLLKSYHTHRIGHLEWIHENKYHRIITIDNKIGTIVVEDNPDRSAIALTINFPDIRRIHFIASRVRQMFDLDSDPVLIANAFENNLKIKKLIKKYPGIRTPSGWNPFEIAIGTILGQLVSVEQGQKLVTELISIAGKKTGEFVSGREVQLFPTPLEIINCNLEKLKTTKNRKTTLVEFSRAIWEKRILLESGQNSEVFKKQVQEIKGIGRWTADYMALKVLSDVDSFPATDLILKRESEKIFNNLKMKEFENLAPWRGYLASLIWRDYLARMENGKISKKN